MRYVICEISINYRGQYTWQNRQFTKEILEINEYLSELTKDGKDKYLTGTEIRILYQNRKRKEKYNFYNFYDYFITTKTQTTGKIYQSSLDVIKKYEPATLSFSQINQRFLRDFETWCIDNGNSTNYIAIHMRNIRAVFNAAIDDEIIELNLYPFRKFKIKREKTVKRNLTVEELRRFRDVDLIRVPSLAREVFMLSFYLIGINLKDLCYLTKANIVDGRIEYKRHKGGKDYSIKLVPEASKLIKKHSGKKYLINLLENYSDYEMVKKEINKKLKVAATGAKIPKLISTYFARHSWASFAAKLDIPKETISAALGHEIGSRVTTIYIDFDRDKVDRANDMVIEYVGK